ncbi:VOC family protein [Paracoccus sediminilitoris]|uniref:VOC family protein n=1 Tax=Paracoccus sediminilitoris TaxID=2202419 RepID=UPI0018F72EA1|nr:VOC family protein [Paracoccus sediminilitoris]
MKPRISVLTLGASNLERSLSFYCDGLGLPTTGIIGQAFDHGAVAFFDLAGGLKLALWAQDDIAHDTGLPVQPVCSTTLTIGHNVVRPEEIDQCMETAVPAGAKVIKTA